MARAPIAATKYAASATDDGAGDQVMRRNNSMEKASSRLDFAGAGT
jgi:hypothetical protein